VKLDADTCHRALAARDRRFDGLFYVGVRTSGIYCRPVCPARTPRRDRCVYFARPAEAEREGFRACLRCRPELAPGSGPLDSVPRLVAEALARIEAGFLNEGSVDELAARLSVSGRHLRRALAGALGVTSVELAQSRRLALAKQLLQDSDLGIAEVAFAAGFGSLRRFNTLFLRRFGRPPSALRREAGDRPSRGGGIVLRLDYRPPFDWVALLRFLSARATAQVEEVEGEVYRRTVRIGPHAGWLEVRPDRERPALRAEVSSSLSAALMPVAARLRALFDLDGRPDAVVEHLRRDPMLGPSVRRRPGLRVLGAFDGFESAARAVLGQRVTVHAATTVAGRLAAALGEPVATPFPGLSRAAPTPEALCRAGAARLAALGMTGAKARALGALAAAAAGGGLSLDRYADAEEVERRLRALPGIGPWTAQVVTMRALGQPDAFPAGDLGVAKALGVATAGAALDRAERWRPWRAYAAMHLWATLSEGKTA
jgi:AraC family transcriptional regulator of adaptative response / DNA-3-methyladenine glycosylase II